MDSIASSALGEICRRGKSGVALASLWNELRPAIASAGLELEPGLKSTLWLHLLSVPELRFQYRRGEKDVFCSPADWKIRRVDAAEELDLKIVGSDGLRDCFLGLYDDCLTDSMVSESQRKALELLALARTDGIAQSELSKKLGIEANNFAYELKSLETRNLITRQPAIIRMGKARHPGDSCKVVSTNLVFMSRYSKHLGSRQKFEVSRREKRLDVPASTDGNFTGEDGFAGEGVEEEVLVKDHLLAMKLVCDRLEKADGRVLGVKDIKKELGFVGSSSAHKAWTIIRRTLEDAGFVKEHAARVGNKEKNCLQLMKNFSPNAFVSGAEDIDNEQQVICGRKNHHDEIIMELPVQQQIYQMVADSGSKGVTSMEVQKRLGTRLSRWFSKNYSRLGMDREKVGVVREEGSYSKAIAYRYRILGNLDLAQSVRLPSKSPHLPVQADNKTSNFHFSEIGGVTLSDSSTPQGNSAAEESVLFNPEESHLEQMKWIPDEDSYPGHTQTEANVVQVSRSTPVTSLTTNEIRRRQKILDRLQGEKFIFKRELYGWLVNLEKEKGITMCRKTMDKILKKLEQQGHCKCVHTIDSPYCSRSAEVVLHPSVSIESISAELQEKFRSFKQPKRGLVKNREPTCPDPQTPIPEATQADGSPLGKMVRAKSALQQAIKVCYRECEQEHHKDQGDILTDQVTRVEETDAPVTHIRKRSQAKSQESTELDIGGCMRRNSPARQLERVEQFGEGDAVSIASSRLHDSNLQVYDKAADFPADIEESKPQENKVCSGSINRNASSDMNPTFRRRFTWTDEVDRKLVIQYARIRAAKGAKFQRVDWNQVPDLPAPPKCCRRRISLLKKNFMFRKSLMGLCNMLSKQFLKHLKENQESLHNNNSKLVMKDLSKEDLNIVLSNYPENASVVGSQNGEWDNFDDKTIKAALEKVLQYKRGAMEEHHDECINNEENDSLPSDLVLSDNCAEDVPHTLGRCKDSVDQSNSCHLHKMHTKLSNHRSISRKVHRSVALSNAVELLKLVLLSPLREDDELNQSAELLRQFSNDELFAAFSYLSEKKFMILRNGDQPLLSHTFLENISKSRFPPGTGQQAAKFSRWLQQKNKDLIQGQAYLDRDLQCGEFFHLFGLVSSGKLNISQSVPEEGVGEAEDSRSSKRKSAGDQFPDREKAKRPKSIAADILENRREKGFPGIRVLVEPASISGDNVPVLLKDDLLAAETCLPQETDDKAVRDQFKNIWFPPGCKGVQELPNVVPMIRKSNESSWDAMAWYARCLMSPPSDGKQVTYLKPDLFRAIYSSIKRAGEQGLTAKEVSHMIGMPGEEMPEIVMHIFQAFGVAIKVNGYDSTRLIDALYCSKYSLPSRAVSGGDPRDLSCMKSQERSDDCMVPHPEDNNHDVGCPNSQRVIPSDTDGIRTFTSTYCHKDVGASTNTVPSSSTDSLLDDVVVPVEDLKEATSMSFSCKDAYKPILPWLYIDGSVNEIVFNGLIRNILGFVMQNPGTLEDNIIRHVDILNPESCRKLLGLMILDKHLIVRKMHQAASRGGAPPILRPIHGNRFRDSKSIVRDHYFANPMSTAVL